jgi:Transglutaminase-like superfamily
VIRVLTGLLLTLVLVIMLWTQQHRLPSVISLSRLLIGENWYAITLHDQHIGYLHTRSQAEPDGHWRYSTHTHLLMQASEPVSIRKTLVFATRAPHFLVHAEQQTRRGRSPPELVRLAARDDGQLVRFADGAEHTGPGFVFTLEDYLRIEHWLRDEQPSVDTRMRAPTLSFDGTKLGTINYTLRTSDARGFVLSHEGAIGRTTTHLDAGFMADLIEVGDVFRFTLTDQAKALAVTSPAFKKSYLLPVESRLHDTSRIKSMTLEVMSDSESEPIMSIDAHRQWLSDTVNADESSGTSPVDLLPALDAMAQTILAQRPAEKDGRPADQAQLADLVLAAVHQRLEYRESAPVGSLERVLDRGYGECTDFADLFTALARATGLPARTVIGLAYQDHDPYGFAFHAWNEARVDGQWQVIDPTWNQRFADATHLPLSDRELANLKFWGSQQVAHIIVTDIVRD